MTEDIKTEKVEIEEIEVFEYRFKATKDGISKSEENGIHPHH